MRSISFGQNPDRFKAKATRPTGFQAVSPVKQAMRTLMQELFSRFQVDSRHELGALGMRDLRQAEAPNHHLQLVWNPKASAFPALSGVQETLARHYGIQVEIIPDKPHKTAY